MGRSGNGITKLLRAINVATTTAIARTYAGQDDRTDGAANPESIAEAPPDLMFPDSFLEKTNDSPADRSQRMCRSEMIGESPPKASRRSREMIASAPLIHRKRHGLSRGIVKIPTNREGGKKEKGRR
jgi:hypothetical protein